MRPGKFQAKGMALIMALFIVLLLTLCGMAFLSIQVSQRDSAHNFLLAEQARQLAIAGLEDARSKLTLDYNFFTSLQEGQNSFNYQERVTDPDGEEWGSFEVTIDTSMSDKPYYVVYIRSSGVVGPPGNPSAVRSLSTEIDVSELARDNSGDPSSETFRVLWSLDEGQDS